MRHRMRAEGRRPEATHARSETPATTPVAAKALQGEFQPSPPERSSTYFGVRLSGPAATPTAAAADPASNRQASLARALRLAHGESGQPLDASVRAAVEAEGGSGLDRVRVHDSVAARTAADLLRSRAFALGSDIFLGSAGRATSASDRQALLTHEAVHAVQQGGHRAPLTGTLTVGAPGTAAEAQAEAIARGPHGGPHGGSPAGSAALRLRDGLRRAPIGIQRNIAGTQDVGSGVFTIAMTDTSFATSAGETGTVSFLPKKTAPKSTGLRFIQIVRVLDAGTGAAVTFASVNAGLATMDTMATTADASKNIAGGFAVDQQTFPAARTAKADPAIEPFYDVTGPPIAGNATGTNDGVAPTAAVLEDSPRVATNRRVQFVSSVKGDDNGIFYGTALWGFETFTAKGAVKVKNEYHSFRSFEGETMHAALKAFDEHYANPGSTTAPKK